MKNIPYISWQTGGPFNFSSEDCSNKNALNLPRRGTEAPAKRRATKAHGPEENPRCWWLPVEVGSWNSITYRVFLHPRWCRISAINCELLKKANPNSHPQEERKNLRFWHPERCDRRPFIMNLQWNIPMSPNEEHDLTNKHSSARGLSVLESTRRYWDH